MPRRRTNTTRGYRGRKRFAMKRAPLVETKKLVAGFASQSLDQNSEVHFLPVRSYYKHEQGLGKDQFIGDSIFAKYCTMKMKLTFPGGIHAIEQNFRMRVIHGWMTAPIALPRNGSFAPQLPNRDEPTVTQLHQLVSDRVIADFDTPFKSLEFRDKERKIYKIEGQRWVRPDRTGQIGHPQDASIIVDQAVVEEYQIGQPPDWSHTITWRPMRKVPLTESKLQGEDEFWYPNESWIPFVLVYTPNIASYPRDPVTGNPDPLAVINVQYNDCLWFTDS